MNALTQPRLNVLLKRCLSRDEAAIYVGIGTTKFDELVTDGRMPKPFRIDGRVLWDVHKLDAAVDRLVDPTAGNPWDRVA
jgi:predicted DNA-binding transcriptional regulator AlpA